jgi:S1-C subfamily serine protease
LVTGFVSSSRPSPVELMGVEEGDVIVLCNGRAGQMGVRLLAAVEGLQSRGEPVVLEVVRNGKQIRLRATKKPPARDANRGAE